MKSRLKALVVVTVLVGGLSAISQADSPALSMSAPATAHKGDTAPLVYLTGKETAWSQFPKKPALGSAADGADLAITLSMQVTRTDEQKKEAQHDEHYSMTLVTETIDADFETKYPKTFAVLKQADKDAASIVTALKKENARLRPYDQHPTLVTPLFLSSNFSYPSGHATGSEVQAQLLATLFPDRTADLGKRARQIADSRVVAGVHYASDTEAGLTLGDLIFQALESSRKFQKDLAEAAKADGITSK